MVKGYKIVSGGTDNHLILVNLKASKNIDGARVEKICDKVMITLNKNSVPGDKSALNPGGIFIFENILADWIFYFFPEILIFGKGGLNYLSTFLTTVKLQAGACLG